MQKQWEEQQRNREAESAAVRRAAWGDQGESKVDDDDMGHTILGDVQYPTPIVMHSPPQQNNGMQNIITALAIAFAAGAGGYMLAGGKQPATEPAKVQFDDESVSIGLGRIEDYLKDN